MSVNATAMSHSEGRVDSGVCLGKLTVAAVWGTGGQSSCVEAGAWSSVHLVARMRMVERGQEGCGGTGLVGR